MKRYDFDRAHCTGDSAHGCPARMEESSIGDYVRWEDLIAAGCLVPVPDGEARSVRETPAGVRITIPDHRGIFRYVGTGASAQPPRSYVIFDEINTGAEAKLTYDTIVQPVRLVRLEDVG